MRRLRWAATFVLVSLVAGGCAGGGKNAAQDRLGGAEPAVSPDAATTPGPSAGAPAASAAASKSSGKAKGKVSTSGSGAAGGAGSAAAPAAEGPGDKTGVGDATVTFGMHLPQSGAVGALVGNAWHGADAYFKHVNDQGGVHGRKIQIVTSDDGYDAAKAAQAIRDLVDTKKVFAASCLAGVDQCVVGATYANSKGVPYLHAGMAEGAVKEKPWTFPTTQTYPYGGAKLVDYLFQKRGWTSARKIGAFVLNTEQLADTTPRVEAQLAKYNARFAEKAVAEKDQNDFSTTITKFQNAQVDTVWFHVDPTLIAKFTSQARALRFHPTYVFFSPAGGNIYATAAGGGLDGAIGVTSIADSEWSGAAQFKQTFQRYYPSETPDEFNILAWVDAMVFVDALKRAGRDLGRDSFARGAGSIDNFNTGVSSTLSYVSRGRIQAGNSQMAAEEVRGADTVQVSGFEY
jgi:branched-chain amino acid transport system substrate-binding protein